MRKMTLVVIKCKSVKILIHSEILEIMLYYIIIFKVWLLDIKDSDSLSNEI